MQITKTSQKLGKTALCLAKYNLKQDLAKVAPEPTNHVWIYDRSGSMYGLLSQLVEDLIVRSKQIPVGDTITMGWFSSEGRRNIIIKGFKVTEARDYSILENIIRQNSTTLGCTCFSEILHDVLQIVTDLSAFSLKFSLCFFTDGYPVVSDYLGEIQSIKAALTNLSGVITSSLLVGYGDYYNKMLMAEMAEKLGGSLTHAANLPSFSVALTDFIEGTERSKRHCLPLDEKEVILAFNLQGNNINVYSVDEGRISVCLSAEEEVVYVLTTSSTAQPNSLEDFSQGIYAAAFLLIQRCKSDVALEVLGHLGDKHLIDMVTNSYTNAEYGKTEESLKNAVIDTKARYLEGKRSNYVSPADAFCLLDTMDLMAEDPDAYFYPRHEDFVYKRIGKPAIQDLNYPKFVADRQSRSSLKDVVWNETKPNLSVRTKINGTVALPEDKAKSFGLLSDFPTYQYRNYTIVKDGILNVTQLPVCLSEASFKVLKENKIIRSSVWESGKVYVLHLDAIPVVNRSIAEGKTSATDLCRLVIKEHEYKGALKALKYYRDLDFPEKEITAETAVTFAEKQQAFLESQGINTKTGAYEPPTSTEESSDFYYAKEFCLKVKGLSSLPKVEVVATKLKDGKSLTVSDTLVAKGVTQYSALSGDKKQAVDAAIKQATYGMKAIRRRIQETKFSVLLCKKWFSEFSSREENRISVDGYEITIQVNETKVGV